MADGIGDRKQSHLTLCEEADVEYAGTTTLFEEVTFEHDALPELALDEIDLGVTLLGRPLRAPLVITGMTGGTAEARSINQGLAQLAEAFGIAFGVGSQRAMHRQPELAATFEIRRHAPTTLILANIGVVQAAALSTIEVGRLVEAIGADALCVHLNPAQELIQPGGDRDFRGGLEAIARLVRELPVPVVVKETGCGISARVGERLAGIGVRTVDVSGAGGTSWVKVEGLRAGEAERDLATILADWGIPTAAALLGLRESGLELIGSGGVRSGLDVARAVALGARVAGVALPVLRAYREGGAAAADRYMTGLLSSLRAVMLLTGSRNLAMLAAAPVVLGPRLRHWMPRGGGRGA